MLSHVNGLPIYLWISSLPCGWRGRGAAPVTAGHHVSVGGLFQRILGGKNNIFLPSITDCTRLQRDCAAKFDENQKFLVLGSCVSVRRSALNLRILIKILSYGRIETQMIL